MAERDTTLVPVNLDRKRPYRVNDADRDAVWVGPGKAEVPAWVAEAWGMTPEATEEQAEPEPPVTVETILEQPMQTTEIVEIVETEEQTQRAVPRKRKGGS